MKKFKTSIFTKSTAVVLSITILGCTTDETIGTIKNKVTINDQSLQIQNSQNIVLNKSGISGEDIFKDVFFLQGSFSDSNKRLSEVKNEINSNINRLEAWNEIVSFSDEAIDFIKSRNTTYFNDFKEIMISGDNYAILDKIEEATVLIEQSAFASERHGQLFQASIEIMEVPELRDEIISLDLTTEGGMNRLEEIMIEFTGEESILFGCTPWAAWCVFQVVGVAISYVIGAYTAIAAASVLVKSGVYFWDMKTKDTTILTEVFISDIAIFYRDI